MNRTEIDRDRVLEAVAAQDDAIRDTLTFVHDHPELAHEEHRCASWLSDVLAAGGLEVERGIAGMDTAFRATLSGAHDGPTVGLVAVFDAVPGIGPAGESEPLHACGHGPISGGIVGAALALASIREAIAGRVVVVGCPADEIHAPGTVAWGGGKALTARAGIWDEVDVALYAHPEFLDTVSLASQWMRRERVSVNGQRSLQEGGDQEPLQVLSQLLAATQGYPPAHVLLESAHLDGDVEEGSALRLDADVLVIDESEQNVDRWAQRLRDDVPSEGWQAVHRTPGIRPDPRITAMVARAYELLGHRFEPDPPPLPFATDFAEISAKVPSALIGVGRQAGWSFHTREGAEQFTSEAGERIARELAEVVALCCADVLSHWPDETSG